MRPLERKMINKTTLGVIVGNRGFFPDSVAREGREEILSVLKEEGFEPICLTPEQTKFGTVEAFSDAQACAELFRQNAKHIDGILVTLPNFGDERGVANSIRMSGLKVPVLVQAYPDDLAKFAIGSRRDSFCGKFSVCSNLTQYGIPFSLTEKHAVWPNSESFRKDLRQFGATCRIVRGLQNARFGAVGVRPASFNSVRYSEKLLEAAGISIDVIDMADILKQVGSLKDSDPRVLAKLDKVEQYTSIGNAPKPALIKMSKLGVVVDKWIEDNALVGTAIQCWTTLQEYLGIVPCTMMAMMGSGFLPSACEVDVVGVIAMYALQLASGTPSAIVDWNNNYRDDDDKCVIFHCSNFPKEFYEKPTTMDRHEILATVVPKEATWGTLQGRIKQGPLTFLRISTNDATGVISAYVAEGESTNDPAQTWGGLGVVHLPRLQQLLRHVCKHNFEHHVSINLSRVGGSVVDALRNYLRWEIYAHNIGLESGLRES
jgi:L-fucose isomerase-like protein